MRLSSLVKKAVFKSKCNWVELKPEDQGGEDNKSGETISNLLTPLVSDVLVSGVLTKLVGVLMISLTQFFFCKIVI